MSSKTIQKVVFALAVLLLIMASFFAGRTNSTPLNVQAQEEVHEAEGRQNHTCSLEYVGIDSDLAIVQCSVPIDNIYYFAVADTPANKALIDRMMAVGLTQMSMNRQVFITYDFNSANNPPGCFAVNCRLLQGIGAVSP